MSPSAAPADSQGYALSALGSASAAAASTSVGRRLLSTSVRFAGASDPLGPSVGRRNTQGYAPWRRRTVDGANKRLQESRSHSQTVLMKAKAQIRRLSAETNAEPTPACNQSSALYVDRTIGRGAPFGQRAASGRVGAGAEESANRNSGGRDCGPSSSSSSSSSGSSSSSSSSGSGRCYGGKQCNGSSRESGDSSETVTGIGGEGQSSRSDGVRVDVGGSTGAVGAVYADRSRCSEGRRSGRSSPRHRRLFRSSSVGVGVLLAAARKTAHSNIHQEHRRRENKEEEIFEAAKLVRDVQPTKKKKCRKGREGEGEG
eukprot:GHVT01088881.1.p1 GENE.GHVT01088881.1~~GHVT01088881.1.p1  ORF type:complete len:315 (-),score=87.63 GHVT01088881.1:1179-2123(-)